MLWAIRQAAKILRFDTFIALSCKSSKDPETISNYKWIRMKYLYVFIIQDGFFDCLNWPSARPLGNSGTLNFFWWDLLCNLTLRTFRGRPVKKHPVHSLEHFWEHTAYYLLFREAFSGRHCCFLALVRSHPHQQALTTVQKSAIEARGGKSGDPVSTRT